MLTAAGMLCAASPASAGQARAVLSVSATVTPSCQVARLEGEPSPLVACSSGAAFSTRTSAGHDERPLEQASDILGAPVRSGERVAFTGAVQPADAHDAEGSEPATRYLTVSY